LSAIDALDFYGDVLRDSWDGLEVRAGVPNLPAARPPVSPASADLAKQAIPEKTRQPLITGEGENDRREIRIPKTTHRENIVRYITGVTGSKTKGDTGPGLGNPNMIEDKTRKPRRGQLRDSFDENR